MKCVPLGIGVQRKAGTKESMFIRNWFLKLVLDYIYVQNRGMEKLYPVYTTIEKEPKTICRRLPEKVFNYPFFNEGVCSLEIDAREVYMLQSTNLPEEENLSLKGLIFHVSHCGSTLLCSMLNQIQNIKVISETEAINGLLLSKVIYDISDNKIISQLRKIISLYQQKTDSKQYLILKLTSWNVYFINLFQQAFPGLKWIYIRRETDALMTSLLRSNGGFIDWWSHPVDVIRRYFLGSNELIKSKEKYLYEMISGHNKHAYLYRNSNSLFVEYPNFIEHHQSILNHFELEITTKEWNDLKQIRQYDSKSMKRKLWKHRMSHNY